MNFNKKQNLKEKAIPCRLRRGQLTLFYIAAFVCVFSIGAMASLAAQHLR